MTATSSPLSSSPPEMAVEMAIVARLMLALEMCIHVLALPVALFSLTILARTSVLHFNLKFLLFSQTGSILLRSLLRIPTIAVKFALQNPIWSESTFAPLQFGLLAAVFFRNLLGHLILAERVLATVYVRNYEWYRRFRWFSPSWFIPMFILAIWNGLDVKLTGQEKNGAFALTSTVNMATGSATLFFNIFELTVIVLLFRYNRTRFAQTGAQQNVHNLSERYQLLENIRTTRQLLPVLALHSLSNLNNSAIQLGQMFRLASAINSLQFLVDTNILGFFNASVLTLAMLLATIICHPILRRNATLGLLRARNSCLGRKGSVGPISTTPWANGPVEQQKMKEEYFKVLDQFWEQTSSCAHIMNKKKTTIMPLVVP